MPPKVQPKDTRTPEQIAIESTKNSNYNLLIPMADAKYVRVRNPLTGKDPHFSTTDTALYDLLADLSNKGLKEKIQSELTSFAQNYNSAWSDVANLFADHLNSSSNEE